MEADGTVLRCQNCHEELEKDWESCPVCKTPTSKMKSELLCPSCKYKIKEHWKECPKCHTELSGWATPSESSANQDKQPSLPSEQFFFSGSIDNDKFGTKITIPDNEVIGEKYVIKKKLGQGGYGSVYLAQDSVLKEQIALKIVIIGEGKSEKAVEQLIHEFKLREKIHDTTHIIKAYDPRSCEYKGLSLVLLPMEFAKDGNFRSWLHKNSNKKERLNKSIELFKQTCLGVKAIHDAGLSHLDIKPENILLVENIVKITDFGIGRYIDNQLDNPLQLMNQGIGTPQYMSPEQFKVARQKEVGHASDIYTLGLLLYEILDGNLPFDGSPTELKEKHLSLSPPVLKDYNDLWWKIISKCLNKNPLDRYQSISFLLNDIARISAGIGLTDVSCPKCNHINKNISAKFCEKCRNDLKELFHPCLVCAKEVRLDVENCPGCNAPISAQYLYLSRKKELEILKDEDPMAAIDLLEIMLRSDGGSGDDEINLIRDLRNKQEKVTLIIAEANNLYSNGELEKAISNWRHVLKLFPRHKTAFHRLEILEKEFKDFNSFRYKAKDFMDEGNFGEAEKLLKECMKIFPSIKEIKNLLDELDQKSHKYSVALNNAISEVKNKRLAAANEYVNNAKEYAPKSKELLSIAKDISEKLDCVEELFSKAKTSISFANFKDTEEYIFQMENIVIDKPEIITFKDNSKKTKEKYIQIIEEAKNFQKSGNLKNALNNLKNAKELCQNSTEADELIRIISDTQRKVCSLLEKSKKYCKSAEFTLSESALKEAEQLWSKSEEISELRKGLEATKQKYTCAVSDGTKYLSKYKFKEAREAYTKAKELCPDSKEIDGLLDELNIKEKQDAKTSKIKRIFIIWFVVLLLIGAVISGIVYILYTSSERERYQRNVYYQNQLAREREEERRRQEQSAQQRANETRQSHAIVWQEKAPEIEKHELKIYQSWPFSSAEARNRQRETSESIGSPIEYRNSVGMEFVLIPAGRYFMGSPATEGGKSDESQHEIVITRPFYMSRYEVTQAEWEAVMGNNPSSFTGARNPVGNISWHNCQDFIKKLSARDGITYRLPTEAEWEWTCRAGTETKYYCGDSESSLGQLGSNSRTNQVGHTGPNAFGLYDMHGNASEWCNDWYSENYFRSSPSEDPQGPFNGSYKVLRGGSWGNSPWSFRSANRDWANPNDRDKYFGFRVVFYPPGK